MNKEEQILINRLSDLANMAYQRNIPMFSDFLNLNEQSILESQKNTMPPVSISTVGGYNLAERKIAAFLPAYSDLDEMLPIVTLKIKPLSEKFAENLNHRDFLGAIMNLGIERCKIGDIIVSDNDAYIFCMEQMAQYIVDNLTRVRHTPVMVEFSVMDEASEVQYEEISGSIASVRLDSVLALCFSASRSSLISIIEAGKVFVNGKTITTNSYNLKEDDIVSARGYGKFQFKGVSGQTKKGRFIATVHKYV